MNVPPSKPYKSIVSAKLNALIDESEGLPKPEMSSLSDMQLMESCFIALNELFRRAKSGGDESTDCVFRLAVRTGQFLGILASNPSPLLLQIAHCNPVWPAFFSPKPAFLEPFRKELERLEIGKDCQLNVSPQSRWSWDSAPRRQAAQIQLFVHECKTVEVGHKNDASGVEGIERVAPEMRELFKAACALPPLSKAKAKLWMDKVGWPLILLLTNGKPEKTPLRILGTHRARHTGTRMGAARLGGKTSESNIRDGIKKLITQALRGMAQDR